MRHDVDLSGLLPRVLAIAQHAGQAIMGVYAQMQGAAHNVQAAQLQLKGDGSPLTQADLLAHKAIATGLAQLTPNIPVVSEEDEASLQHRLPSGNFWLIDPLDGTKEFLACSNEFTVNIALVQDGAATLGVVTAPALGLAYWGGAGLCAHRAQGGQTTVMQVAAQPGTQANTSSKPLRVVASKSHLNDETRAYLAQLGPHQLVQAGSSLKFCRIAEGQADVYPRLGPTCEWDTAAAQVVLEAAGGYVLQLDRTPLRYGKPNVLNPHFVAASAPQFALQPTGTGPRQASTASTPSGLEG